VAKLPTFATSTVTSSPSYYLNVCPGTGCCSSSSCGVHNEKILVEMTGNAIVLSFTATGAHNLNPASHLLNSFLVSTQLLKSETTTIPKKGIPKLDGTLRADHRFLAWTGDNAPTAQSR